MGARILFAGCVYLQDGYLLFELDSRLPVGGRLSVNSELSSRYSVVGCLRIQQDFRGG